jgi:murein DD-endopeptidase MepM/ murein hydrolase activator NlpD
MLINKVMEFATSLFVAICLFSVGAASACAVVEKANPFTLTTDKPVLAEGARLSASFGMQPHPFLDGQRFHSGVDWTASLGTPVAAGANGLVRVAARRGIFGNMVMVDHGAGWHTLYAHLSAIDVKEGDCITSGTVIGTVGNTGLSAEPHLHFEVQLFGKPVDPQTVPIRRP